MTKTKLYGLFRLFRFELPFSAGMCVLLGELLALGHLPSFAEALLGFFSVFFISSTALILNDYFDIEIDKINSPSRPLPSGIVSKSEVISLSIIVALLGFYLSYLISVQALSIVIFVWFIGFLYNWRFKKYGLLGNLFVCFSVGMTFILGGIVVGKPFEQSVWFMAFIATFIDLGEEIAADSLDYEGDRQAGSRSLAVIFGPQIAMRISAGVFVFMVACTPVPFFLGWLEWLYLLPIAILDIIVIFSTIKLLNPELKHRIKYIRAIYLGGLIVVIMFIVLRLTLS